MLGQITGAPQDYLDKSREKLRGFYRWYPLWQVALVISYLKKVTLSHAFMQMLRCGTQIPLTFIAIMPTNKKLLDPTIDRAADTALSPATRGRTSRGAQRAYWEHRSIFCFR
jgi:hypothetical protein